MLRYATRQNLDNISNTSCVTEIHSSYQDGIKEAISKGYINVPKVRKSDTFSHLVGIDKFNSRFLHPIAKKILQAWPSSDPPKRILELGPGAGMGAATMSLLAPQTTIHTAGGRSPINPYWKFEKKLLLGKQKRDNLKEVIDELSENASEVSPRIRYSLDELKEISQETGVKIFEIIDSPFIEYQSIHEFPDQCELEGTYDFIYDGWGPNWYASDNHVAEATYKLLSPNGILCMNSGSPLDEIDNQVHSGFSIPMGDPVIADHTLTVNRGSFLAPHIEKYSQKGKVITGDEVRAILSGLINETK